MIRQFSGGRFGVNLYILYDKGTKECAIVDPGAYLPQAVRFIEEGGYAVKAIILTHGHGDHILALPEYLERFSAPVMAHKSEKDLLGNARLNFTEEMSGKPLTIEPDRWLEDGDAIQVGADHWVVIHTPGHTKGGICLHHDGQLIAGDTLFRESVGRWDLYGGDYPQLKRAILQRLLVLPDSVTVYPGHGPETTIGHEKQFNPLIR